MSHLKQGNLYRIRMPTWLHRNLFKEDTFKTYAGELKHLDVFMFIESSTTNDNLCKILHKEKTCWTFVFPDEVEKITDKEQ